MVCHTTLSVAGSMQDVHGSSAQAGYQQHETDGAAEPSQQHQLIQKIRRRYNQETVVGRSTEDDEAIRELALTVASQAKLLSTELYTKPTHFVLELLQNADDCSYAAGVQPRVLLVVMPDAILHATNETGFKAAEVEAICTMARSTKSRKAGAFTGEKGIGFKATAVASEVTFISSNGYTFAFDMRPGAYPVPWLGLVCPRWEQDLQQRMLAWLDERLAGTGVRADILDDFTTRMWMQLKPDLDRQKLARELCLLDPYMLLNLRKLKDVAVLLVQPGGVQLKHLKRVDLDETRISIGVQQGPLNGPLTTTTNHLLCMRRVLQVPAEITAGEEKRQGVSEVEVVFALPMNKDASPSPDPQAQVFAFLPVRAYGFRFHIQADLVLPSSREGILESRPWNRWLQTELPATFVLEAVQAVRRYHQQPSAATASPQPALSSGALLQYLPLAGDVQDAFMGQVSTAIMQGLSKQPCVLTASGTLSQPTVGTLLPEPLLSCTTACDKQGQQDQQQQLISNEWLQQGLPGMQYVCNSLLSGPDAARTAQLLLQLGAKQFTSQLLLSWLCSSGTAQILQSLGPPQRAAWLPLLYSCCMHLKAQPAGACMHLQPDSTTQQKLKRTPILQVYGSCGRFSLQDLADSGQQVFLWDSSLGDGADLQLLSRSARSAGSACSAGPASNSGQTRSGAESGSMRFLDPAALGPDGFPFVSTFLGVHKVPLSLLVKHILQLQKGGQLSDAQQDQLLLFLMRNAALLSSQDLQLLRQGLLLCRAAADSTTTSTSRVYVPAGRLHLPLHATSSLPISQDVLSDSVLQQDLAAAGVAFVSSHYAGFSTALQRATSRQAVWPLLRSFGVQELKLLAAVQQLLKLYSSSSQAPVTLQAHQRHLQFLSEAARDPVCLQHTKESLRLYTIRQDPTASTPASPPGQLFWPMAATAGANAVTDQLSLLCEVQLVHPGYVLGVEYPGNALVKSLTTTLTPVEVWRQLVRLHKEKDLQAAASSMSLSLQELLLQQLTYLAGVRLQVQEHLAAAAPAAPQQPPQHQQHQKKNKQKQKGGGQHNSKSPNSSVSTSADSSPQTQEGLLLLSSRGKLLPSSELYLPPQDAAALEVLQDMQACGCGGLPLLHPCFEPFWRDTSSEQCLLLTSTLGARLADTSAVLGAVVKLHKQSRGTEVTEERRGKHLAYLAQHTAFLQQQPHWLHWVQEAVLLLDAEGQHRRAKALHLPLGPQFAGLESDMCAAGMLFLHSSYTAEQEPGGASGNTSSSSILRRVAGQQLKQLLVVLGVQESDVNSIVQYVLKLYSSSNAARPSPQQHLAHMRFIMQRWADLSDGVRQQFTAGMPLLVADAGMLLTLSEGGSATSAAPGSGSNGSTHGTYVHDTRRVYTMPAAGSPMLALLQVLHLGGASFLHPVYESSGGEELSFWLLSQHKAQGLTQVEAAKCLLRAHTSCTPDVWQSSFTPAQMAHHALAVAAWGDPEVHKSSKQQLLLAVQGTCPAGGLPAVTYQRAGGQQPLYFPATGHGWALQEVLLPGQVPYLHPAYAELLSELPSSGFPHQALRHLLERDLGIQMRPIPGPGPLQQAIASEGCKRSLLLLLGDEWGNYEPRMQQVLQDQLSTMQVDTTCGRKPLQQCFLPRSCIDPSTAQLLAQLQLPCLQLHDTDSPNWDFLQALGVSMELNWPTLLKILQHLSSTGAQPAHRSMKQLYKSVSALEALSQVTAAELRAAFAHQPLLYVPHSQPGSSRWYRSSQVVWGPDNGISTELFPHLVFIAGSYKESLVHFSTHFVEIHDSAAAQQVAEHVRCIYELLAKHSPSQLQWLPQLMSKQPVLLVQQGGSLSFSSGSSSDGSKRCRSSSAIYLPDSDELLQLFSEEIRTLAVPQVRLPALQPLLACVKPSLPSLSASVRRSFAAAAAAAGAAQQGRVLEPGGTQLLQQALPLFARYLYWKHNPDVFMPLLRGGHFLLLSSMPVFLMAGLTQTLQLGSLSRTVPTQAAVQMLSHEQLAQWLQEQQQELQQLLGDAEFWAANGAGDSSSSGKMQPVLLVDAEACQHKAGLLAHTARACVDLVLSLAGEAAQQGQDAGASPAANDITTRLRYILTSVDGAGGNTAGAVQDLLFDGILALPAEYDPWAVPEPGAFAAAATGVESAAEDGSEDGEGSSDAAQHLSLAAATASATAPAEAPQQESTPPPPRRDAANAEGAWQSPPRPSPAIAEAAAAFLGQAAAAIGPAAAPRGPAADVTAAAAGWQQERPSRGQPAGAHAPSPDALAGLADLMQHSLRVGGDVAEQAAAGALVGAQHHPGGDVADQAAAGAVAGAQHHPAGDRVEQAAAGAVAGAQHHLSGDGAEQAAAGTVAGAQHHPGGDGVEQAAARTLAGAQHHPAAGSPRVPGPSTLAAAPPQVSDQPFRVHGSSGSGDGAEDSSGPQYGHRGFSSHGLHQGGVPQLETGSSSQQLAHHQQQQWQDLSQQQEAREDFVFDDAADEPVPQDLEARWLEQAMAAAHATAAGGASLAELAAVPQQPADQRHSMRPLASPASYIVELPTDLHAGSFDNYQPAAYAAAGPGLYGGSSSSSMAGATAAAPAVAGSPYDPPGTSWGVAADASIQHHDGAMVKTVGDVGEVHVYERLRLELPDFNASCWYTNSRQLFGLQPLPPTTAEPAFDFLYTDSTGKLSGRPAGVPTRCFIEVKATKAAVRKGEPRPFYLSRQQWELARSLHHNPQEGLFVIVRVERVGCPRGPRIAAVLRDPVQLLKQGQLWVTSEEKLLLSGYPVLNG